MTIKLDAFDRLLLSAIQQDARTAQSELGQRANLSTVAVNRRLRRLDLLQEMQRSFKACPQIQQCYYVAGECDFVLVFLVRDMEQYVALTHTLFHGNNNVKSFKTLVAMDRVKCGMDVPVELQGQTPYGV
ncbi:Lrp/AsnC family transcriptional regulator [Alcaligenaceae bacterium]|nr:Lrp/AsnC family transcriptional regulator [Alcaligenaceae bacterium]